MKKIVASVVLLGLAHSPQVAADAFFDSSELHEMYLMSGSNACRDECESDRYRLTRLELCPYREREQLYLVTKLSTPGAFCGSAGCESAVLLRKDDRMVSLEERFGLTQDRAERIARRILLDSKPNCFGSSRPSTTTSVPGTHTEERSGPRVQAAAGVDWNKIEGLLNDVKSGDWSFFYDSRFYFFGMRAFHAVIKPVAVSVDSAQGYFSGALLGAAKGAGTGTPHGALAGAVASLAKDVGVDIALALLSSYLETPQAIGADLGNQVMAQALAAWDHNFDIADRIYAGEELSRAEKMQFAENHVAANLFGAGRILWQKSRRRVESQGGEAYVGLVSTVASTLSKSAVLSEASLAAEVLGVLRSSEVAVEEYPPLVDFFDQERRLRQGVGLAVRATEGP